MIDTKILLEALEAGLGAAEEVAAETHAKYLGYKPQRHKQVDADVDMIKKAIAQLAASQPAQGYAELLKRIDEFPELNMNNYTEDQVRDLNQWGVSVALAAEALMAQPAQGERKPVAWQLYANDGRALRVTRHESIAQFYVTEGNKAKPLYE